MNEIKEKLNLSPDDIKEELDALLNEPDDNIETDTKLTEAEKLEKENYLHFNFSIDDINE